MVSYTQIAQSLCDYYYDKHPNDVASAIEEVECKLDAMVASVDSRQAIKSEIEENTIEWSQSDIKNVDWFVILMSVKKCLKRKSDGKPTGGGIFSVSRNRLRH